MQAIDNLPLWAFFLAVVVAAIFWKECGYRIGERRLKARPNETQASLGTIVGSVLGLLAFMLGFTFNVALNRFDARREAVLHEANAIGTTYLRVEFFDAPYREEIKKLLREYVQVRIGGIGSSRDNGPVIEKSEALQDKLWAIAANIGREHQNSPVCALFISSLNEIIDMHARRVTVGVHSRVPTSVWVVLFIISFLAMLGVGYYCGLSGNRSRAETLVLVTVFTLVIMLVVDLDRPFEGFIKTNQQPMIDLQKTLGPP